MVHLIKLAVGARSIADIAAWQASRTSGDAAAVVGTRQFPKRAAELADGGSLFWVVGGLVLVRQAIVTVRETRREDGTRATAILVDRTLVPVAPRPQRAFQGWRYLAPAAAPPDLAAEAAGADALPAALRRELASLCLL